MFIDLICNMCLEITVSKFHRDQWVNKLPTIVSFSVQRSIIVYMILMWFHRHDTMCVRSPYQFCIVLYSDDPINRLMKEKRATVTQMTLLKKLTIEKKAIVLRTCNILHIKEMNISEKLNNKKKAAVFTMCNVLNVKDINIWESGVRCTRNILASMVAKMRTINGAVMLWAHNKWVYHMLILYDAFEGPEGPANLITIVLGDVPSPAGIVPIRINSLWPSDTIWHNVNWCQLELIHSGPVMPYGDIDLGQHWLR